MLSQIIKNRYFHYFIFFLIFQLSISPLYAFRSQFIIYDHQYEEQFLFNIEATSDILQALIASGVDPKDYSFYTSEIERWKSNIENQLPLNATDKQIATTIGYYLHEHIYTQYKLEATTLKDIFETGNFNCLSGTIMMNILLRAFGIEANSIVLPTHVYTVAILNGKMTEIENTIPDGLSISQDTETQARFNKLTGFDYSNDATKKIVIDWVETLGLLYSNRSYFSSKNANYNEAFQNMIKAQVFLHQTKSEQKNLIAGYLNHSYYTYKNKNSPIQDYLKTLSILEEGINRYPNYENLRGNYLKGLDIVIEKMIKLQAEKKVVTDLINDAKKYLSIDDFQKIKKSRYIRAIIHNMRVDTNYIEAKKYVNDLIVISPNDQETLDIIQEYSFATVQKELKSNSKFTTNPKLLNDLKEFPIELTKESLSCYYSGLAKKNFEKEKFSESVQMMKDGKNKLGNTSLIIQNGFAYAVNSAQHFIAQENYLKAIEFYKASLLFKKEKNVINNLGILYEQMIKIYLSENKTSQAEQLIKESITTVPNHPRLKTLQNNI